MDFSGLAHHQELDKSQEIPWDSGPRFTNPLILCRLSRLFPHDPGCLGSTHVAPLGCSLLFLISFGKINPLTEFCLSKVASFQRLAA